MPRGSNSEVEVSRIRNQEKADWRYSRTGTGAKNMEIKGYGRKMSNTAAASTKAPKA